MSYHCGCLVTALAVMTLGLCQAVPRSNSKRDTPAESGWNEYPVVDETTLQSKSQFWMIFDFIFLL